WAQGDGGRRGEERRRGDEGRGGLERTLREEEADEEPGGGSEHRRHSAEGRGEGIGGEQPFVGNDFGQTRRQCGEEEPVHREGEQGEYVYAGGDPFGGHDEGDDDGEDRPGEVAIQQHLAPSPPIEERPGEGPNDRERKQQDRERAGNRARRCEVLRREEEQGRKPDLEHPIAALRYEPDREQFPESREAHESPQIGDDAGATGFAGSGGWDGGV